MTVFLSIDGVLNQGQPHHLDPVCIQALSDITDEVVLVGSWKNGWLPDYKLCSHEVQNLVDELKEAGVQIIDRVSDFHDGCNGVLDYVETHQISRYIILDTESKPYLQNGSVFCVNPNTGLTETDVSLIKCRGLE